MKLLTKIKSTHQRSFIWRPLALDPYTTHGHDGILDLRMVNVLNDET